MTVGFRPTPADNEIIQAHKRPEESTSDVLRRALRALDRQRWDDQARLDMERIAASNEDLSEEPDDWAEDEAEQFAHATAPPAASNLDRRIQEFLNPTIAGERTDQTQLGSVTWWLPRIAPELPALRVPVPGLTPLMENFDTLLAAASLSTAHLASAGGGYRTLLAKQAQAILGQAQAAEHSPPTRRPTSRKLAQLHAARARRAGKR
ncbi:hypothetical protein ACWC5F_30455 [Streptomyces sp. NPDC001272]